jgi:hypothetical protein
VALACRSCSLVEARSGGLGEQPSRGAHPSQKRHKSGSRAAVGDSVAARSWEPPLTADLQWQQRRWPEAMDPSAHLPPLSRAPLDTAVRQA